MNFGRRWRHRNTALRTARTLNTIASLVPSTETPHRHLAYRGHSVVTPRQMSRARRQEGKSPGGDRCPGGQMSERKICWGKMSYIWIGGDVQEQTSGEKSCRCVSRHRRATTTINVSRRRWLLITPAQRRRARQLTAPCSPCLSDFISVTRLRRASWP